MTTTSTVSEVPVARITEADGINPRRQTDEAAMQDLVRSIKRRGILQPLLVRETGKVKGEPVFELIAGKRRLAAAKAAGLKEVPIYVRDLDGDAKAAALSENIIRQDLTPLEEADAVRAFMDDAELTAKKAAQAIGKSDDWVNARLRLLKLPPLVREAIDSGQIGLHAVPAIARAAEASPPLAEQIIREVIPAGDNPNAIAEFDRRDLEDPGTFLEIAGVAAQEVDGERPAIAVQIVRSGYGGNSYKFEDLPLDPAVREVLQPRYEALPDVHQWGESGPLVRPAFRFDEKDADAARAFGCLLELEGDSRGGWTDRAQFITDLGFIGDRVEQKITRFEKDAKKAAKGAKRKADDAAAGVHGEAAEAAAEEEKRQRREAEKQAKIEAQGRNLDLGTTTAEAFRKPKIDLDLMRFVVRWAFKGAGSGLASRGLRYVDERLQQVEQTKRGEKRTFATATEADAALDAMIEKAKTPEELAGVFARAMVCAALADEGVVAQSNRANFYAGYGWEQEAADLAMKRKAVPPSIRKAIADNRKTAAADGEKDKTDK